MFNLFKKKESDSINKIEAINEYLIAKTGDFAINSFVAFREYNLRLDEQEKEEINIYESHVYLTFCFGCGILSLYVAGSNQPNIKNIVNETLHIWKNYLNEKSLGIGSVLSQKDINFIFEQVKFFSEYYYEHESLRTSHQYFMDTFDAISIIIQQMKGVEINKKVTKLLIPKLLQTFSDMNRKFTKYNHVEMSILSGIHVNFFYQPRYP